MELHTNADPFVGHLVEYGSQLIGYIGAQLKSSANWPSGLLVAGHLRLKVPKSECHRSEIDSKIYF